MSEEYRKFDAENYVKTEEDARGLLGAATDEDIGDGAVVRAALRHVARTHNMSASTPDRRCGDCRPTSSVEHG